MVGPFGPLVVAAMIIGSFWSESPVMVTARPLRSARARSRRAMPSRVQFRLPSPPTKRSRPSTIDRWERSRSTANRMIRSSSSLPRTGSSSSTWLNSLESLASRVLVRAIVWPTMVSARSARVRSSCFAAPRAAITDAIPMTTARAAKPAANGINSCFLIEPCIRTEAWRHLGRAPPRRVSAALVFPFKFAPNRHPRCRHCIGSPCVGRRLLDIPAGGSRAVFAAAVAALALAPAAAASPIPERTSISGNPEQIGGPATANPLSLAEAPRPPRHPFMAPNDRSNIHDDAYQTDTADLPAPLGRAMGRTSTFYSKECASVTFDSRGRIVTICVGVDRPQLKLLDPASLAELATMDLPPRKTDPANTFSDFSGGGYFYLDHRDRAVVPTTERHLLIVGQGGGGFRVERDFDLSALVGWRRQAHRRHARLVRADLGGVHARRRDHGGPGQRPHPQHGPPLADQQLLRRRRDRGRVHRRRRRAPSPGRRR